MSNEWFVLLAKYGAVSIGGEFWPGGGRKPVNALAYDVY
jgi:hypothetical protein